MERLLKGVEKKKLGDSHTEKNKIFEGQRNGRLKKSGPMTDDRPG